MGTSKFQESLKSFALFVGVVAFCVAAPVGVWILVRSASVLTPAPLLPETPQASHTEVVLTLLAGLTISIAFLGLIIAALAIWGYGAIKREARKIAANAAQLAAIKTVKSPEIQKILLSEARKVMDAESTDRLDFDSIAKAQPPQVSGVPIMRIVEEEKVGKPRPKKGGSK